MSAGLNHDAICPGCKKPIGDHTIRGWEECLKAAGFDYELPFEDMPDGPVHLPGVEGELAGEVTVMAGVVDSALGQVPCLRFVFICPGADPMSRRPLKPINLVMDEKGLDAVARLVRNATKRAIAAARKAA